MIELRATIESGSSLQCWTKSVQGIGKLGEFVTFEISRREIVLSGFHSSRSVFQKASFPKSFFRGFRYGLKTAEDRPSTEDNQDEGETGELGEERLGMTSIASTTASRSMRDIGSTLFQLQTKVLSPVFRKIERDIGDIQSVRLSLVDQDEEDDDYDHQPQDQLGRSSSFELIVVKKNKIEKTYRLDCLNINQQSLRRKFIKGYCPFTVGFESRMMRRFLEHMSSRADEFRILFGPEDISFASRTSYVAQDGEVLKHPVHTEVKALYSDMDFAKAPLRTCLKIKLKEFRSFVQYADGFMGSYIKADFSPDTHPLVFEIHNHTIPDGVELLAIFECKMEQLSPPEGEPEDSNDYLIDVNNTGRMLGGASMPLTADQPIDSNNTQYATQTQAQTQIQEEEEGGDREPEKSESAHYHDIEWNDNDNDNQNDQGDQGDAEFDDFDEDELDRELENQSQLLLGPTQGQSQAEGLFGNNNDDEDYN